MRTWRLHETCSFGRGPIHVTECDTLGWGVWAQTLARNALLLANHQAQLEGEAAAGGSGKSKVKVEDLVRLCDNLLTNLGGLCDSLAGAAGTPRAASLPLWIPTATPLAAPPPSLYLHPSPKLPSADSRTAAN